MLSMYSLVPIHTHSQRKKGNISMVHAINGKTHYKSMAMFNSYIALPDGNAYAHTHTHVCEHMCICTIHVYYIYICVCVFMHVYIYIYIYRHLVYNHDQLCKVFLGASKPTVVIPPWSSPHRIAQQVDGSAKQLRQEPLDI